MNCLDVETVGNWKLKGFLVVVYQRQTCYWLDSGLCANQHAHLSSVLSMVSDVSSFPTSVLTAKLSRPRDSLSISAPKTWRAVILVVVGSGMLLSGSHSSWFSSVVRSVSVEAFEWCWWTRCWGVAQAEVSSLLSMNFRHVQRLSIPRMKKEPP